MKKTLFFLIGLVFSLSVSAQPVDKATLKSYFTTGAFPSQANFQRLIDSAVPDIRVDQYGAVGDGVTDDAVAINAAITAAGVGKVVYFTSGKTYLIKDPISITGVIMGYGATIKRCDAIKTTTTANVSVSATSIAVTNGSVFKIGDTVILLDATSPYGGTGYTEESNLLTISNIVGNTLTVNSVSLPANGNLTSPGYFASGSKVLKVFPMMNSSMGTQLPVEIYGLTLDGNRANNTDYLGWPYNGGIRAVLGSYSKVQDCTFKELSNEGVFIANHVIASNNTVHDCNGSFVHISQSGSLELEGNNLISNNNFRNMNETDQAIIGHSEGIVTFSNRSYKTAVIGNIANNSTGALVARLTAAGDIQGEEIIIANNQCYNLGQVFYVDNRLSTAPGEITNNIQIVGNKFINCGSLAINAQSNMLHDSAGVDKIKIANNLFVNTKFWFANTTNMSFTDNDIIITEDGDMDQDNTTVHQMAFVNEHVNLRISGNSFDNRKRTYDSNLRDFIYFNNQGQLLKVGAVNTKYYYGWRNVTITDNKISNYNRFITPGTETETQVAAKYIGVSITNNKFQSREDANVGQGAWVFPGWTFANNEMYGNTNATSGLIIVSLPASEATLLVGPIVKDNTIIGYAEAMRIGRNGVGNLNYGVYCRRNIYSGTVDDNTVSGTNNSIGDNIAVVAEQVPNRFVFEDSGDY